LLNLRQSAASAAAEHDLAILACGTHPLALWRDSVKSPKDRYSQIPANGRSSRHAVRDAHPRRISRSTAASRCDESDATLRAAVHRPFDVVTVLARPQHRTEGLSSRRL